jgi:hypothetical protein
VVLASAGALVFSLVTALTVYSSAQETGVPSRRGGTTIAALADHGTEAFAVGASFVGFFVFVTFIALIATELSGGTFRALLLRDPHRLRLIVGKLAGILLVAAGVIALAELLTFVLGLLVAPGNDVSTDGWLSLHGLTAGLGDFATAMAGVTGWAIFGTTLAVIFRSAPIALGVGFAWAGPFENITVDSWETGFKVFPGQVLGSLIQGGSAELSMGRAVVTATIYAAVAALASLLLITRRDVTA